MYKRTEFGSKTATKMRPLSSRTDCPWDTIAMVPTDTVAGQIEGVGRGFDLLDTRLGNLKASAGDFAAKVAA